MQVDLKLSLIHILALQTTLSEVSRMGHIVEDTLEKSRNVMFTKDFQDIMEIKEMEENCLLYTSRCV